MLDNNYFEARRYACGGGKKCGGGGKKTTGSKIKRIGKSGGRKGGLLKMPKRG
jgi:hypothetical protein